MQITRQRFRPELNINTREKNPSLVHKGETDAPINLITRFEEDVLRLAKNGHKQIHLQVHPFIAAYLTKGLWSIENKWHWQYKIKLKVQPRDSFKYLEYKYYAPDGKELLP